MSKRIDSHYGSNRSSAWLKIKCAQREHFVVVGFTPAEYDSTKVGSLVLATFHKKVFRYAGNVGTGFTERDRATLFVRLAELRREGSVLKMLLPGAQWVEPRIVADVQFAERTLDGSLRHPTLKGLRDVEGNILVQEKA